MGYGEDGLDAKGAGRGRGIGQWMFNGYSTDEQMGADIR
jgi:hypothetical protein